MSTRPASFPDLDTAALAALEDKYAQLLALRRARDATHAPPPDSRPVLRALSRRFPGCLRELDRLTETDLAERLAVVRGARAGAATPTWVRWVDAYHRVLAAALWIRTKACDDADSPDRLDRLAEGAAAFSPVANAAFVRAALQPPRGKLAPLILAEVGAAFGEDPHAIGDWLFPPRRPRRAP